MDGAGGGDQSGGKSAGRGREGGGYEGGLEEDVGELHFECVEVGRVSFDKFVGSKVGKMLTRRRFSILDLCVASAVLIEDLLSGRVCIERICLIS